MAPSFNLFRSLVVALSGIVERAVARFTAEAARIAEVFLLDSALQKPWPRRPSRKTAQGPGRDVTMVGL
jgi:hypothetical protein